MRKTARNLLLDKLHRGVVIACMGLTLYGTSLIGLRVYNYFAVTRPTRQQQELKMFEEGASEEKTHKFM